MKVEWCRERPWSDIKISDMFVAIVVDRNVFVESISDLMEDVS